MTEATITDRRELRTKLDEIRERGWSSDEGENAIGIACLAVALPSPTHRMTPCRARCRQCASARSGVRKRWLR